jgi:hypothetical protein
MACLKSFEEGAKTVTGTLCRKNAAAFAAKGVGAAPVLSWLQYRRIVAVPPLFNEKNDETTRGL